MEQHKKTIAATLWDTRKALDAAMASERDASEILGRVACAALKAVHDPSTGLERLVELDRLLTVAKAMRKIESNRVSAARVAYREAQRAAKLDLAIGNRVRITDDKIHPAVAKIERERILWPDKQAGAAKAGRNEKRRIIRWTTKTYCRTKNGANAKRS